MKRTPSVRCLVALMLAFAALGCNSTRDITHSAGSRTDYVAGQIYELKQPVFLFKHDKEDPKEIPVLKKLGVGGTPKDLVEFQRQAPRHPQIAGLLLPGDHIQVTKFVQSRSFEIGNILHVYATILRGESQGIEVDLFLLSREVPSHYYAFVDPDYLEPVGKH